MNTVLFLQNAYSKEWAGKIWPRRSWLTALKKSRSGQRLRILENLLTHRIHFNNTTPAVGDNPDSILPPDLDHMRDVISRIRPSMIISCGSQAFASVMSLSLDKPVLAIPHPAFRVVTNQLFVTAAKTINDGFTGVVRLRQLKGEVKSEVVNR